MRSLRLPLAVLLVLLLTAAVQLPSAAARPFITGVAAVEDDPLAFARVGQAGASLVHRPVNWSLVAPRAEPASWRPTDPADPNYDWADVDSWVANAVAAGLTPVIQVWGAPAWAQRCSSTIARSDMPCDPRPDLLADFATAAATRYSGRFAGLPRVRFWQGLNEPNLSLFFNPQFRRGKPASPALYRSLINAFYRAVKRVHRSNIVIAAGLGPIGVPRYTIAPMRFARELLCMKGRRKPRPKAGRCGGGVRFDVFDIHPYTTGSPSHEGRRDDVQLGDLEKLPQLLRAAERAGRIHGKFRRTPLWVMEFSWDSRPPDPGGVPMRILRRWTAEAMYRAWDAGITRFFWLALRDNEPQPSLPPSETTEAGLYFRGATLAQDREKPSLAAFRFPFVAYAGDDGLFYWGRTPKSARGSVSIQVRRGGGWRTVATARAGGGGTFAGTAPVDYGANKRGVARARFRGATSVPFSMRPVRDRYQPPFG